MITHTVVLRFAITACLSAAMPPQAAFAADLDDVRQEGLITATTADSITIGDPNTGDQLTFVVNAATKITRNGKPVLLRSVRTGEFASISARQINERRMAATIRVKNP